MTLERFDVRQHWRTLPCIVGITGTNGKTSTTHLLGRALRKEDQPVLVESTLGYFLNDEPLSVARSSVGFARAMKLGLERGARHAGVEVTSSALAGGFAARTPFEMAIFTNLTRDHFDLHGCWEHYRASKAHLFRSLRPGGVAVLNACDPSALHYARQLARGVSTSWYSVPSRGPELAATCLSARVVEVSSSGTRVVLQASALAEALGGELELRFIGEIFAENGLAAALAALRLGVDGRTVRAALSTQAALPGRFQLVHRSPYVVVDFAHTADAIARTLVTARQLAGSSRVSLVFGAGGERDTGKREQMGRAAGSGADLVIITTDNCRNEDPACIARALLAGVDGAGAANVCIELDRKKAIARALDGARSRDVVIIAGRGPETHQIVGTERLPFSDERVIRELLGVCPAAPTVVGAALGVVRTEALP